MATPTAAPREFSTAMSAGGRPVGIAAGLDGHLWFTVIGQDRIGRITPSGTVTDFSAGITARSLVSILRRPFITTGPGGNLWFTEPDADRIVRITPAGAVSEYPPTAAIRSVRLRGSRFVAVRVRCPSGAARECRGTLRLHVPDLFGEGERVGVRCFSVAPGCRADVTVPLWAAGRRQLKAWGRLEVQVLLVPSAHSMAGAVERSALLRLPRPPAVAG